MEVTVERTPDGLVTVVAACPNAASAADIDLEVIGDDRLQLTIAEGQRVVHLPCAILANTARVVFRKKTKTLTFTAEPAHPADLPADTRAGAPKQCEEGGSSGSSPAQQGNGAAAAAAAAAAGALSSAGSKGGTKAASKGDGNGASKGGKGHGSSKGGSKPAKPAPAAAEAPCPWQGSSNRIGPMAAPPATSTSTALATPTSVPPATAATPSPSGLTRPAATAAPLLDDGTHYRASGYSMAAPAAAPRAPLPAGLPPVAPNIDCRYLAVANGLRISAHGPTAALAELLGARKAPSSGAAGRQRQREAEVVDRIAATLDAYGYAVLDNFLTEGSVKALRSELVPLEPHYSAGLIWVGKEAEAGAQISVSAVRGDVVLWLDGQALNATAFVKDGVRRQCSFINLQQALADIDELVFDRLRHHPRLPYLAGMHRRSDAHMAIYPGKGARFAAHVDNTTTDGRRLTVVAYLNPGWTEKQGGALRVFPVREGAAPQVDVLPLCGRVAMFLSAEVAHEVMPAWAVRHAVTLWYYDAGEHAGALAAAKAVSAAGSSPSAQAAARELLRDLLADGAASTIEASAEGCRALALRVAALEPGAQEVIAAVTGAPNPRALVESMQGLTPDRLADLRASLRTMGLDSQHHAPDTSAHVKTV